MTLDFALTLCVFFFFQGYLCGSQISFQLHVSCWVNTGAAPLAIICQVW